MPHKRQSAAAKGSRARSIAYEQKRVRALELVIAGATQTEAAKAVGVKAHTVGSWVREPDAVARLEEVQRTIRQQVEEMLASRAQDLVNALIQISIEGDNEAARVNAIKYGLSLLGVSDEVGDGKGTQVVVIAPGSIDRAQAEVLKAQARALKAKGEEIDG